MSAGPLILAGLAALLCVASIVIIASAGRESPRRIRTFSQTSDAELACKRSARRLRRIGGLSLALALHLAYG